VPIGVTIEGQTRVDSASQYSFIGRANQPYLIFLESLQGGVHLGVYDSTHGFPTVVNHSASAGGPWLEQNPSNTFGGSPEAVYRILVWATLPATTARFRFKVHAIDTRPERVPALFSFGDTVIGETIDPMYDLDWFQAPGLAGQEIVTVVEPAEPVGAGSVGLSVIDDSAHQLLGGVFADAGAANQMTTGRLRLAGSHDYRFAFGAVTSYQYPRYRGPYRFWTYVIDRAPEHRAATTPFNTELRNERIDRAGDVDEFTFSAATNTDFNAFLQSSRALQLELVPLMEGVYPVVAAPADTSLFAHATGRFHIAQAGTYTLRLSGTEPSRVADTGSYRFYLYAIDRRPEHVPAAITPGDTVTGERLELPGDVDEFTFSGVPGEEYNAFLQARDSSPNTALQVEVVDVAGAVIRSTQSVGSDTGLLHQPTGRFALTSSGTYRLRVSGVRSYPSDLNTGPYRLLLYRVDRRPEHVPVALALGDSVTGESIDVPGDADEYRVVVGETTGVNLVATLDAQPEDYTPVAVQLFDANNVQVAELYSNTIPTSAGTVQLVPGVYKLRVDVTHWQDKPAFRGPYRLWLYSFRYAPELVSDTFAIGDTVSGEVIAPWGDVDRFRFHGQRGQHINVALQGLTAPSASGFQAWITGPSGFASLSSTASDTSLRDHQTRRLDVAASGWYQVEMTGFGSTRGAYRFLVEAVGTAPESSAAALVPGDSVLESIDAPGDWDEFTVTATPGAELNVILHGTSSVTAYPTVLVSDPSTGDSLAGQVFQAERVVGPFVVPASGHVTIAVYQPGGFIRFCYDATCGGALGVVGPYSFRVMSLNRAPENVPSTYTVGDTVRGEAVSPIGDIDEFTSSGTPGDVLSPWYHLTAAPVPAGGLITLEIVNPANGTVLVGAGAAVFGTGPPSFSPGTFRVPSGGQFIVRVHSYGLFGTGTATAPYEFFVKRGP
jgi:hypothetical protein